MKIVYVINGLILFSPESCSLVHRDTFPAGRITLHGPASECLHILLSQPGLPVTQKALFEQVWQKKGVVVSTNTLYQSIASIRKGLKAVGLEEDIIRTLPKQGFQCNAHVQSGSLEEFITPPAPVVKQDMEAVVAAPAVLPVATKKKVPGLALILSGLISLAMVGGLLYWMNRSELPLSPQYFAAGQIEHCTLFSSWSGEEYSQAIFDELRQRYPVNCAKEKVIYLTINRLQYGSSLIACNKPIEHNGTLCRTIVFKDEDNDNE